MVIQLLEFTPLLFSSMFKNGGLGTGTAGGGNRNHWGRVISVCMYTMALGLRFAWRFRASSEFSDNCSRETE